VLLAHAGEVRSRHMRCWPLAITACVNEDGVVPAKDVLLARSKLKPELCAVLEKLIPEIVTARKDGMDAVWMHGCCCCVLATSAYTAITLTSCRS
jgi:hypothetical protein